MRSLAKTSPEQFAAGWWSRVDDACRKAFFVAIAINVLAFGFEMTNLTLNHDDVGQIFIQDTILGGYLGRFGSGWLHYYTQNHYFMPFLQMAQGILLMSVYGVVVAWFWGARKTLDVALVASILCVFPYMAHVYQFNTAMAQYPLAHLLAALAVVFAVRGTVLGVAIAAMLYVGAFSIYQSVAANAATLFVVWLLTRILFGDQGQRVTVRQAGRSTIAVLASVLLGGAIYLAVVSMMHMDFDTDHAAAEAFRFGGTLDWSYTVAAVWNGTRSFFLWPQSYFPDYLKDIQLAFLVAAGGVCLWIPRRLPAKLAALGLLALSTLAPRALQVLHPHGSYHYLALTAYAMVVAGAVMIVVRSGSTIARNVAIVFAAFLLAGYVMQCNWNSTVNYLNTQAHFNTLTQVLARLRALPDVQWDGKKVVVVGSYEMPGEYPFKIAPGVANKFMDANHMSLLARLMRDEARFVNADATMPKILEYAASHDPWPNPGSVAVVDGVGVVVFAKVPGAGE
jgi:hypothetical protein